MLRGFGCAGAALIDAVLTGGSAATIYAPEVYSSLDADFILGGPDFPRGPLAVGGDYVREFATLERGELRLRILTPFDCVRDRLAHFYHWDDYTALNAAVGVARRHREQVDVEKLREWTERESAGSQNHIPKFREFLARLG